MSDYNILEARIEYNAGKLKRITVLIDCTSPYCKPYTDVRAIYATTERRGGYMHIYPTAVLTPNLLQQVAAAGMETVDRDDIFPQWRKKLSVTKN